MFDEDEDTPASVVMDSILFESVALLEGIQMLEGQRPRVLFDCRDVFNHLEDEDDDLIELLPDFPLLRLPLWMEFEIVIYPESYPSKGGVEAWLDKVCRDGQVRSRIRVRE